MPNLVNNHNMKTILIKPIGLSIILFVSFLSAPSRQTFKDELKQTINSIDNSWIVDFDTEVKYNHLILKSGTFLGLMRLKKNKDLIEYYIYNPINESLTNEILQYHMSASCTISNNNNKHEILKFKEYLLFLPMYPCWKNGYSEDAKKLIDKMVEKLK